MIWHVLMFMAGVVMTVVSGYYAVVAPARRREFDRRWDEQNPSHDNPPSGYGPCTREDGHDGPCALPLKTEGVSQLEESLRKFGDGIADAAKKIGGGQ